MSKLLQEGPLSIDTWAGYESNRAQTPFMPNAHKILWRAYLNLDPDGI